MDAGELLGLSVLIATIAVLISASISDWKRREVSDRHWMVLGTIGLASLIIYSVHTTGFRWEYICLAAGVSMILLDILSGREFNPLVFYAVMALLFIVPLYPNMSEDVMRAWASIPLCYLIYVCMYILRIIRGGADVKCLIVLSISFPIYPQLFGLPLIDIPGYAINQYVFSISVLLVASLFTIPIIVYFVLKNAKAGVYTKRMFSGYRMDISDAERSDVWPLEDIIDAKLTRIKIPDDEKIPEIYARLRNEGCGTVWVTPMIPFIIMITIAVVVVTLVGSPLFLIA
ncbi:MAG: hypothetical protein LBR42_02405 [Candidatus Methanoplasma sp.]|jgi:preflagellin peptidase FlaK|nr:hypothetical protein [Candidatus Methanoplasma sp.]